VTVDRPGGTVIQRVRAAGLAGVSWIACRLPEGPLIGLADLAGSLAYRLSQERATHARRNLHRIVEYLVANGSTEPRILSAAADPRRLEALVRSAFRHHARYYLEVMRAPGLDERVFERITVETPELVEAVLSADQSSLFVTAHLGPIELPAVFLARRSGRRITAPMETLGDPALQRWFERTRGVFGVHIVGLREARRELLAALRRGEIVGLVADRDITGGGIEVPLFGAPAALPAGPALLLTEVDVPFHAAGIWRTGRGRYAGRLIEIPVVREGTRRQRIIGTLTNEARAYEELISRAPEQWTAIFFPIWPDLEAEAARTVEAEADGPETAPAVEAETEAHAPEGDAAPEPNGPTPAGQEAETAASDAALVASTEPKEADAAVTEAVR
jgi:lauroyl/myristoyl acyltransferase